MLWNRRFPLWMEHQQLCSSYHVNIYPNLWGIFKMSKMWKQDWSLPKRMSTKVGVLCRKSSFKCLRHIYYYQKQPTVIAEQVFLFISWKSHHAHFPKRIVGTAYIFKSFTYIRLYIRLMKSSVMSSTACRALHMYSQSLKFHEDINAGNFSLLRIWNEIKYFCVRIAALIFEPYLGCITLCKWKTNVGKTK